MCRIAILLLLVALNLGSSSDIVDLTCESDQDCVPFRSATVSSTCLEHQCRCTDLQQESNATECRPVVNRVSNQIGGQCPCQIANSFCNEQTQRCVCQEGFLPSRVEKKCVPKSVPLGGECEDGGQCSAHDHFAHCDPTKQVCQCQEHFVMYEHACHSIIAVANLTKPCETNDDCNPNNGSTTVCQDGQCLCGQDFVADASNSSCLPIAAHDQPCTDSNQCIATLGVGSVCYQGRCACDTNHFQFPLHISNSTTGKQTLRNVCERKIVHGDSCNDDQNCYQFHLGPHEQSMECFMNACVCINGYTERNSVCFKASSGTVATPVAALLTAALAMLSAIRAATGH
ncbi:multiple epidermal growth factor-like domains protein 10 [Anopheles bellator]|uniref:multiple epidermal growth factor-like domains protein 10 n=1 Tax=Anopheles bellator TaxID=139047 RepID=UPI0026482EC7|nr:multiple epidermal growth factor-like domains protein 10 [Anopheles bellator]